MSLNGSRIPDVPIWARAAVPASSDPPAGLSEAVSTRALWACGVHLVFGVPAAFAPQCEAHHLTGYVADAAAFREAGVQHLWCLSVNDPFVMSAWLRAAGAQASVGWVADANADFSRAMGMDLCLEPLGMGTRCRRFALLVRDGHILHMAVEPPGHLLVSGAPYMLSAVRSYLG